MFQNGGGNHFPIGKARIQNGETLLSYRKKLVSKTDKYAPIGKTSFHAMPCRLLEVVLFSYGTVQLPPHAPYPNRSLVGERERTETARGI